MKGFAIYQIRNLANDKLYIGSTNNTERRWKEHLQASRLEGPTAEYPLQRAMRKYGIENFAFEILERVEDRIEVIKRERYYIQLLNSLTNSGWGYNQTLYTDCALRDPEIRAKRVLQTGRPCCILDGDGRIIEIFQSLHSAGRRYGIDASAVKGSCDGIVKDAKGLIFRYYENGEIVHNKLSKHAHLGVCGINVNDSTDILYFKNISEAARETGAARVSISKSVNGSTRYSRVYNRIWRNIDLFGNIIENEIEISSLLKED